MKRSLFVLPLLLIALAGCGGSHHDDPTTGIGEAFTVTPASAAVAPGGTVTIAVVEAEYSVASYGFSVKEGDAGGTLGPSAIEGVDQPDARTYTAPATTGTYHVVAGFTETNGTVHTKTATITVAVAPSLLRPLLELDAGRPFPPPGP